MARATTFFPWTAAVMIRIAHSAPLSSLAALSFAVALLAPPSAAAQANVTVDLSKAVNILTDTTVGVSAFTYDANTFNAAGVPYLRTAGITALRYPGNHGIADLYHWSTKSLSKYKGTQPAYFAPEADFASFAQIAEKLGSAVIVVNYGTNAAGTGGAEPQEAAAWVAYANGDPADTRPIGKDSTGQDWQTVGYWATLRSDAPFAGDDGVNSLRISHPKPFGFKLWQVGDQVYNNGYLGGDRTGNPDLHGPAPTALKDFAKLKKDPKLSPTAFADNYKLFAKAMKVVDPTIQVGIGVTTPPAATKSVPQPGSTNEWNTANNDDKVGPEWTATVLKSACPAIDFVSFDYETGGVLPPDYKSLDEVNLFPDTRYQISGMITSMLDTYKSTCPTNHVPRIALSSAQIKGWTKQDHPVIKALWIADAYTTFAETGFANVDLPEVYGDSMMSADRKKFGPAFYGLQMLHIVAHAPGDALLEAKSSSPALSVHATRRRDGIFGLMLINTDPKATATVKVSLKGPALGTVGKRFDYGTAQYATAAGPMSSALTVTGNDFTITVPPLTVTDLLLPMSK
jgi:hypothetical protein